MGGHATPTRLFASTASESGPVNLNELVVGMSNLLHQSLGENIQVETVLAATASELPRRQLKAALARL
jgi:hypothetical protein